MPSVYHANQSGQDTIERYTREFPSLEQVKMMTTWLAKNEPGTFTFTGLVDPADPTVVTPQATVDYGYCWFSLSEGPAIVRTPTSGRFFSLSVFDMLHNTPGVIVNPVRPTLLIRPGQTMPDGDYDVVEVETDQGLAFTRMVVVDNIDEVRRLSADIRMAGGRGDMYCPVARFSPRVEQAGRAVIAAAVPHVDQDNAFGKRSGDVGELTLACAVMIGQLGTPRDTVRYALVLADADGAPLTGTDTYEVTVPKGIVRDGGYFSLTVYGTDNRLLIPNPTGIYDRTTYTTEFEADGTAIITVGPLGEGKNGLPTGKPFYAILRAYVPVQDAEIRPTFRKVSR
jgi:hypothetical protein